MSYLSINKQGKQRVGEQWVNIPDSTYLLRWLKSKILLVAAQVFSHWEELGPSEFIYSFILKWQWNLSLIILDSGSLNEMSIHLQWIVSMGELFILSESLFSRV